MVHLPRSARGTMKVCYHDVAHVVSSDSLATNTGITSLSSLADEGAWRILEQFLSTNMTYPDMEEALSSYLGDRYCPDDWKAARDALFSGDGDDSIAMANLLALKATHVFQSSSPSEISVPQKKLSTVTTHARQSLKRSKVSKALLHF